MTPTFTKLLAIRIVANNRSESAFKAMIFRSDSCFSSSISLMSVGDREKKAISEAEAKPEQRSNNMAQAKATQAPKLGATMVTP